MAKARMAPVQVLRRVTLGVILVGMTVLTILHQRMQGIPTIDSLDPFGGLETLLKFAAGGEIIKKIEPGTIVLFGGVVALGLVLSRFFCGWFCGFGALQAIFGWIGRRLFKKRPAVPAKADRYLRWLKYPALVLIIYFTWRTGTLVIRPYDPLAAYGHLSAGFEAVWGEFAVGFVLLVASLALSLVYERAFCKYLCPLGAVNAILSRVPFFRIKRVKATCISCAKCDKTCPMNVDISKPEAINDPECIACMECVTACPTKKNSLQPNLGGKVARLGLVVGLGFAIYVAAAAVGQVAGYAPKSLSHLAAAGKLDVADIKGSSTWEMVAEAYGIELERIYHEARIDMKRVPQATMLKDTAKVGGYAGFEADSVRVAVARILGVPYTPVAEGATGAKATEPGASAAPAPAAPAPATPPAGATTAAPAAVPAKAAPQPEPAPAPAAVAAKAEALVVPADFALEGTMTINEVAEALKASSEAVIAKLGLPAGIDRGRPLRDMREEHGYTMPELKERIRQ